MLRYRNNEHKLVSNNDLFERLQFCCFLPEMFYVSSIIFKNVVYQTPVNNEDLWTRIYNACEIVRGNPDVFKRVHQPCRRRVQACIENDGGHVEHLL